MENLILVVLLVVVAVVLVGYCLNKRHAFANIVDVVWASHNINGHAECLCITNNGNWFKLHIYLHRGFINRRVTKLISDDDAKKILLKNVAVYTQHFNNGNEINSQKISDICKHIMKVSVVDIPSLITDQEFEFYCGQLSGIKTCFSFLGAEEENKIVKESMQRLFEYKKRHVLKPEQA